MGIRMGIEFFENFEELELNLQFLFNFSHEWQLEWDQLLVSEIYPTFFYSINLTVDKVYKTKNSFWMLLSIEQKVEKSLFTYICRYNFLAQ